MLICRIKCFLQKNMRTSPTFSKAGGSPRTVGVGMLKNIIEAERDQDADCTYIDEAVRVAEQDIAALASLHLDTVQTYKEWSAIRDRTILAVRNVRRSIVKRADEAKEIRRTLIETLRRERAACSSDDKALQSLEYSAILPDIPTKGLLDHLRYLIRVGDIVRFQSLSAAFETRQDRHPYVTAFEKILTQHAFGDSGDLYERLLRICRLAEEADAKITDLCCRPPTITRAP
jgi:hypothetical protein